MRWSLLLIFVLRFSPWGFGQGTYAQWHIADANSRMPMEASLTIEFPRAVEPLQFEPKALHLLQVKSEERVHLLMLEQGYMLHSSTSQVPFAGADTLLLSPLRIGMEQPLAVVAFIEDSFRLDARSLVSLERLRAFMEMHPSIKLVLRGLAYSDNAMQCERTGRQRARSVWEYLVTEGIDPARLRLEGRCGVLPGEPLIEIGIWAL